MARRNIFTRPSAFASRRKNLPSAKAGTCRCASSLTRSCPPTSTSSPWRIPSTIRRGPRHSRELVKLLPAFTVQRPKYGASARGSRSILRPTQQPVAPLWIDNALHSDVRRGCHSQWLDARVGAASGLYHARAAVHLLVPHRHRREPARSIQSAGGPLVPNGDDVVHFFRSDVLRRILRRPVLRAQSGGALACRRWREDFQQIAVAQFRRRVAEQRPR